MVRALLCLLAWLVLPAGAATRVSITLLADAQVAGPTIQLGEIARLRSPDLALMRRLVGLPVGRAPRPGEAASIQARQLAAWIERQAGVRRDEVDWSGAQDSQVQRQVADLSGEEIARAAQAELRAVHRRAGVTQEVAVIFLPRDLQVPRGPVRLHPRIPGGPQLRGRTLVWVDVWVDDAFVRSVPVSLHVPGAERMRAPTQGMPGESDGPARSPVAADPGTARLAVERGDQAALRTTAGAVQLESRVEVLEDGHVGDVVRVRQQGATALLSARVTGPGQVEVAP